MRIRTVKAHPIVFPRRFLRSVVFHDLRGENREQIPLVQHIGLPAAAVGALAAGDIVHEIVIPHPRPPLMIGAAFLIAGAIHRKTGVLLERILERILEIFQPYHLSPLSYTKLQHMSIQKHKKGSCFFLAAFI